MNLPIILLSLAGFSVGAMVIAIWMARQSHREADTAIFPMIKEEENIRARRARASIFLWAALSILFLISWLVSLYFIDPSEATVSESQPSQESTTTTAAIPAPLSSPAAAVTIKENEQNITKTIATTSTATATPLIATPTPVTLAQDNGQSYIPAPSGAKVGPIQFATRITSDNQPINPNTVFPPNVESVYAVFPYSGMKKGVNFKVIWYYDGNVLWRDEREWQWGNEARYFSFVNPTDAGQYKLELHVNDDILATGLFEVR